MDLTYTFEYNDIESFKRSLDPDVAAVILEPVVFEAPKNNFLHEVATICKVKGIVLIFDEMWTGFRMSIGGAQEYFGIKADLATFSKAVANGMPLSVLTGRKDIMDLLNTDVFFFTTFGGEALSLAAAKATILEMKHNDVLPRIHSLGAVLQEGLKDILNELTIDYVSVSGYNFRSLVSFNEKAGDPLILKSFVQQEMIKRGILWSGFHNISYSHTIEDIGYTLWVYEEVLALLKEAVLQNNVREQLKGEAIQPTFRKTSGFNSKPNNR